MKTFYAYERKEAQCFLDGLTAANKQSIHSAELFARRGKDGDYYVVQWVDDAPKENSPQA